MKTIKSLKKHRWFIWAIVSILLVLGGLACYVYYVAQTNDWATMGITTPRTATVEGALKTPGPVTQVQAIGLVKNLPEVKAYMSRVSAAHGNAHVAGNDQVQYGVGKQAYWSVHVYQSFPTSNATFAWYEVYQKTGVIKKLP